MSGYIREGPLQLVHFNNVDVDSEDRIHLDHANLKSVLDKTNGHPLCILCICGPSRQGKSFLLANIVRYLEYLEKGEQDWINDMNRNEPLHGFKFRNGMKSQTQGIWIWSKPFIINSSLNGDQPVSVLVLDTQGTQDEFADAKTMSSIVGLSLLMSSSMIFNVFKQLKEDDLLSLDSYINYGKLVLQAQSSLQEEESSSKPYQKLTFVIRDWNSPFHYPMGSEGGNKFIQEVLKLKPGQSLEAKSTRKNIKASFQSVDCFLMPHPGEKAVLPEFNGHVADLRPPFVEMLKSFMDYYFCSDGLPLKQILGNTITAADLQSHLDLYISTFNSPEIPSPQSVMEATIQVVNRNSVQTALQTYVKFVEKSMKKNNLLKEVELKDLDTKGRRNAKSTFSKIRKFGDINLINDLEEELDGSLSREFTLFQKRMKDIQKAAIQEEVTLALDSFHDQVAEHVQFSSNNKYLYFEESFITTRGNAVISDIIEQIQDKFDGNCREVADSLIELQGKLEKVLEERFLWENQARQKMAELAIEKLRRDMGSKYQLAMQEKLNNEEVTDIEALDQLHQNVKAEMAETFLKEKKKFSSKQKSPSKHSRSESELGPTDATLDAKMDKAYESIRTSLLVRIEERAKEEPRMEEANSMNPGGFPSLQNLSLEDLQLGSSSETIDVAGIHTNPNNYNGSGPSRGITFHEPIPTTIPPTPVPRQRQKVKEQEEGEDVKQVKEYCLKLYETEIRKLLESKKYVTESELQSFHTSSRKLALNHFKRFDDDGTYDEERDDMLAKISSEFAKLELDNKTKIDLARSVAEKLAKECYSNYEERFTESLDTVNTMNNLKKCHNKELQAAEDEFMSKCPIKDGQFTSGYISQLRQDIEEIFDEIKDSFKLKLEGAKESAAQTLAIQREMLSARQLYDDEMKKHFMNNEFIIPQALDKLHEDISAKCEASCSQKCAMKSAHKEELVKSLNESFQKYKEQNDMNLECEDAAIGIDLGTTYSCVAVYAKGKVRVIPNSQGHYTTPSYVQFKDDGSHVVGDTAKRSAYEDPENTIFDAKRIIGRKIDDPKLQQDMKMWAFTVESERGDPNPKINVMGQKLYPEQISAKILKEMKDTASKFLRKPVTKAVITVPAYFTDGQKQATKDAGDLAGLEVLTILTEPVAVAIAYKKQHADTFGERGGKRNILIFDLGGGTFDVAVVVSTEGKLDVLSIGGDDHLGGEDFDRMLMEHCAEEFKKSSGVDLFDGKDSDVKQTRDDARRRLKRLQGECEKKKKELSSGRIAEVSVDSLYHGKDLSVKISRGKFEEANEAFFQSTITAVESTLKDAKVGKDQINDIVLVGGSTRIPKIQELLCDFFGGQQLDKSINPDEAVAVGAAMKAAVMNGSITKDSIDFTQIQDVTPMSIGVEVYGGDFSVIIPKGTKIPVRAEERYKTAHNNQTSVQITIYQGEKVKAVENKKLGDFYLNGIPPKDAEVENIDVEMTINAQGILHVNARTSGGDSSGITVTENKDRMSRALIKQLLGDGT